MHILLTGRPGIGKSTAIEKVIQSVGKSRVGGFLSREIRESGRRTGFEITTLDGQTGVLAHVDRDTGPRVGKYRVNVEDIENIAIPSLRKARRQGKLIVIDEIASMELQAPNFRDEVRQCLEKGRVLATIQNRRGDFLDSLRNRDDIKLFTLTKTNRDMVPARVLEILGCND
jgi:nucleoside-triphosphatase